MTNVIQMRGAREAPKADRSRMETLLLTPDIINNWRVPPFQRPLRVNAKVVSISESLKYNGGIIDGVISLGTVGSEKAYYIYDGQHRMEAARISGLEEFIADVRICKFDSLAEMAAEFVKLNTAIVRLGPDDVLRGLEGTIEGIQIIREECPFVGYDNIRRGTTSPSLSMSSAIRCWIGSSAETPSMHIKSISIAAQEVTKDVALEIVKFLKLARAAWGSDLEYARLWGNLNLCMNMWLWRRLVLQRERGVKRIVLLEPEQFKGCLMGLSASSSYLDWLVARQMTDRDRSPCLMRIKQIFVARLKEQGLEKPNLPSPHWVSK